MLQFRLTMMCATCKGRISDALVAHGYKDFEINMETSILTVYEEANPISVISAVNSIGYKCEKIDDYEELSADDVTKILMENEKSKYQ